MAGAVVRRAPYKDFLQAALQSRFVSTGSVLLGVAYLEAILLASWDSIIWVWFPIGPAGLRAILIFVCGLAIIILRIAHFQVGLRTTGPGLQVLTNSLSKLSTYETAFWYSASSMLFTFVFLQSASVPSSMNWILYFHANRPKLNEKPIFLACYMFTLGLHQTARHYLTDIDAVPLIKQQGTNEDNAEGLDKSSPIKAVFLRLPKTLLGAILRALLNSAITLVLYHLVMRNFAWNWALMVFRPFYNLPKSNMVPPSLGVPVHLFLLCIYGGILLGLVWDMGNLAFTTYITEAPLKNGKPLTFEAKDPNGSLLNGLKAKKPSIKSFALWELANIAQEVGPRRQAIYQDIDRKEGPMWNQMYGICMEVVKGIETRIDNLTKPLPPPAAPAPAKKNEELKKKQRISAPLREDAVLTSSQESALQQEFKKYVRDVATSPTVPPTQIRSWVGKTLQYTQGRLKREQAGDEGKSTRPLQKLIVAGIKYPMVASLFLQDYRTRFAGAVLGLPYAEPTMFTNAIVAMCKLATHSLVEDQFGNVYRDVPTIIRTLTLMINKIQSLREIYPKHWTDTSPDKGCPEVDIVVEAAKAGLQEVLDTFEPYYKDLRLTMTDMRVAKEAAV